MKKLERSGLSVALACASVLASAPGPAVGMEEGFYMGFSASAENLDATFFKTTDNTHPMNATPSSGRSFHVRDSDTKTTSGFGILAGYTFHLNNRGLYLSGEVDLAYHSGKARGRLKWIKDSAARENAGSDPDWPQSGESWPDDWTFEKDYSYGLTLRLGGQPDFLASALGPGSGLHVLIGVRRTEAEYFNAYEGCPVNAGCPGGREDESYVRGFDRTDKDYTAWTAGIGLHTPIDDHISVQVETYYTDYDREDLLLLDNTSEPYIRVPHALDAEEVGLRLRLLRHF
ncbi:MAG: outer membrane beta-barrel protein [Gammaproteobacteria bacterium]|nr:outer membrane beta-barrel protein [Gammaproteobacteria bacterium]